jgi:hypothetical protein
MDMKAQYYYGTMLIIKDKDGYTNIREEPDGKSKIIGQVHKYEVFYSVEGCEDMEISPPDFPWLYMCTDNICGYIYKKNIIPLYDLPTIPEIHEDSTSIILKNDSIEISMITHIFNPVSDKKEIKNKDYYGLCEECIASDFEIYDIVNTLNRIIINYKDKKIEIFRDELENYYYAIRFMTGYIGPDSELYIQFCGAGDAASYCATFVFYDDKIVQEFITTSCW